MAEAKNLDEEYIKQDMEKKETGPDPGSSSSVVLEMGDSEWTPEEEAAIRRKFDLTIVPLVTFLYMLCAIDR